jgi:long-chain acyl-CoA synthetase
MTIRLDVPDTYRPLTVSGGVRASAKRFPRKVALVEGDRRRTYAELDSRMDRVGWLAASYGAGAGDRVAVLGPNSIEFLEVVLGCSDVGVAAVTLSHRLNAAELADVVRDARPAVLFADEACRKAVEAADLSTPVVWFGPDFERRLAGVAPADLPRAGEWDIFSVPYTSGTTGRPKGVLLPHRARAMIFAAMAGEYGCFGADDRFLAFAPFAHGAGLCFGLAPIFYGGTCEMLRRFDAATVVRKLATEDVTGVFFVPTQYHSVFALDPEFLAAHRTTRLKAMISNAAALPQALKARVVEQWGPGLLHETYGCTEVGISTNIRPPDQLRKQQCVGTAFPMTEVKVVDEGGRPVAPGEIGEIYTISPFMFDGYWQDGARLPAPTVDGWFSAGDLARVDDEGYVYVVDRKKDMIVSGGINVYPRQIEEVLFTHPAVLEAAVVGVPDERWGERLKAFVVPRAGAAPDGDALVAHCMQHLSAYKVPREFEFLQDLPKNANGKVLKRALRDLSGPAAQ